MRSVSQSVRGPSLRRGGEGAAGSPGRWQPERPGRRGQLVSGVAVCTEKSRSVSQSVSQDAVLVRRHGQSVSQSVRCHPFAAAATARQGRRATSGLGRQSVSQSVGGSVRPPQPVSQSVS